MNFETIFLVGWGVLLLTEFWVFSRNRNAGFKRKYFLWFVGIGYLSFSLGWIHKGGPPLLLLFFALAGFLALRTIKFCRGCGRTVTSKSGFFKLRFCPDCGVKWEGGLFCVGCEGSIYGFGNHKFCPYCGAPL